MTPAVAQSAESDGQQQPSWAYSSPADPVSAQPTPSPSSSYPSDPYPAAVASDSEYLSASMALPAALGDRSNRLTSEPAPSGQGQTPAAAPITRLADSSVPQRSGSLYGSGDAASMGWDALGDASASGVSPQRSWDAAESAQQYMPAPIEPPLAEQAALASGLMPDSSQGTVVDLELHAKGYCSASIHLQYACMASMFTRTAPRGWTGRSLPRIANFRLGCNMTQTLCSLTVVIADAGFVAYAASLASMQAPVISYAAPPPPSHAISTPATPAAYAMDSWLVDGAATSGASSAGADFGSVLDSAAASGAALPSYAQAPDAANMPSRSMDYASAGSDRLPGYESAEGPGDADATAAQPQATCRTGDRSSAAMQQPSTLGLAGTRQHGLTDEYGPFVARPTRDEISSAWLPAGSSATAMAGAGFSASQYRTGSTDDAEAAWAVSPAPGAQSDEPTAGAAGGAAGSEGLMPGSAFAAAAGEAFGSAADEGDDASLLSDMASTVDQDGEVLDEAELPTGADAGSVAHLDDRGQPAADDAAQGQLGTTADGLEAQTHVVSPADESHAAVGFETPGIVNSPGDELAAPKSEPLAADGSLSGWLGSGSSASEGVHGGTGVVSELATAADTARPASAAAHEGDNVLAEHVSSNSIGTPSHDNGVNWQLLCVPDCACFEALPTGQPYNICRIQTI